MAAPDANTFDLVPPRRPGTNDFNGITKSDDQEEPPDPQTMPNAAEWNTMEYLILAATRVMPVAVLSIVGGTTPTLNAFPNAGTKLLSTDFTITRVSPGVVQITWPANSFPPSIASPMAGLNSGPGMIHAANIANGVQVNTYDQTGAAADRSFTVAVY